MGSLVCSRPGEILFIDFVTLDKASDGRENVLVMCDGYSKLVKAGVTRNQTAETVVKLLLKEWIFVYGTPEKIHSDQGRNCTSKIVKGLCDFFNIKKSQTTPYHPMGNGQVKRANRTIQGLLRTLNTNEKKKWPMHIDKLIHAYNNTPHCSTGYTPFYLMFLREDKLPIERIMNTVETINNDWLEVNLSKMIHINCQAME